MISKALTIRRRPKVFIFFDLFRQLDQNLPVKVESLPQRRFAPPRIRDIELKDGRTVLFEGKEMEVPLGTKERITGKSLKVVAGAYLGSVIAAKKEDGSYVRLRDNDIVDLPKNSKTEVKILPSFRTE